MLLSAGPADLFVANSGAGTVGEYTTTGQAVNPTLIPSLGSPTGVAVSGTSLYTAAGGSGEVNFFTTSGSSVNSTIPQSGAPWGVAASGSDVFVTTDSSGPQGCISEFTSSGNTVADPLISNLGNPLGIAISGNDLFVADNADNVIGEYTTAGAAVKPALIHVSTPIGVAVSGSRLFVVNGPTVGEYTTSGSTIDSKLITGLQDAEGIAVVGSNLFIAIDGEQLSSAGTIAEYTTSGKLVNPALITGLSQPEQLAVDSSSTTPGNTSLVSTISGRLPSTSLLAGDKIAPIVQIVRLTNNSSSAESGTATVSLLLSTDPSGASGGTSLVSVSRRLAHLKPGSSVNVPIAIRSLPAGLVGNFYAVAQVTDPSGNTTFSASNGTISVAPSFVDLQPLQVHAPTGVKPSSKGMVVVSVVNNGNIAASGNLGIDLQASSDGAIDENSIDLGTLTRHVVILPGKRLTLALSEIFPASGGPYYVVADVDPADTFNEKTLANNLLASSTTVKLT